MTNTNDFRRYSYSSDPAYLINQFDFSRGSQAPKIKPQSQPDVNKGFKVHENKTFKTKSQLKAEQKRGVSSTLKIAAVAVTCFVMIALVIGSLAVKNELTKEIAAKQTQIANAQSENISLQSELDSLVSVSMIDDYAVNKLGMKKVKSNQIQYVDVDGYKAQKQAQLGKQANQNAKEKPLQKQQVINNKIQRNYIMRVRRRPTL